MAESGLHPALRFAGNEIRRYLLLAGLDEKSLPEISLCAGDEADDAYTLEASPERIVISGSNPRSALIGSYAYLKEIGFAFYAPGDDYTRLPCLTGPAQLAVRRTESRARHSFRGACVEGAESLEHMLSYIDWMPKAGMNTCFIQFFRPDVFFDRWYGHRNNPLIPPEPLTEADREAFDRTLTREIKKRGLLLHRAGHGWTSRALGYTGNGWYREEEPADERIRRRIALLHGERRLFGGVPANTNLCFAREDVQQALAGDVATYAKAHPETDALHFWLADTFNNVCECEACRKTTLSDQYVRILNRIDEALTEEGLSTRIVFLLYQELLYPPRTERIRHPNRFILMFAPISRTFETSYPCRAEPGRLSPYRRNEMTLPLGIEENLKYYAAWRQIFPGDAFIYDYHLGRVHYGDPGYMKIARTLYRDIGRLQGLGFQGMIACQEFRVMIPSPLPVYLMGRMLWDGSAGWEDIVSGFFSGLYGENGSAIRQYFEKVSALCDTDYANANGPRRRPDLTERYREIARLSREEEEQLPESDDPLLCRYRSALLQNAAYGEALASLTQGDGAGAQTAYDRFCRIVRQREKRYPMDYDVYRAIEVTQRYTGLQESAPAGEPERVECT